MDIMKAFGDQIEVDMEPSSTVARLFKKVGIALEDYEAIHWPMGETPSGTTVETRRREKQDRDMYGPL